MSTGINAGNGGALTGAVRAAGVVGEGGAGFPAHVKFAAPAGTVIANGCECEPLLYTDQRLMTARADSVVRGLRAVADAVGAKRAVVAIKAKYAGVAQALAGLAGEAGVEVVGLENFYPAGDEHILVREVTGRSIPPLGLPREVDALVSNVGTLVSVDNALAGRPVTRKTLTVTGEVARPGVMEAPIGASMAECLDFCGGPAVRDPVFILGGPMMGRLVDGREALSREVVTKTSGGLIALPRGHVLHEAASLSPQVMRKRAATACIQCRYCTDLCPRHLVGHSFETHRVMRAFAAGADDSPAARQAAMCCECGACELFACPMGLSPRRINAWLKAFFRREKLAYDGPREVREEQALMRPYRKIPTTRLAARTGLAPYLDIHPEHLGELAPDAVRIPLSQHIGAPATPVVLDGTRVAAGDVIGEIPESALGARIHASISGVARLDGGAVVIKGA
jgi:Na+-translocating ferredoxin:NAD+ oxidoreductase RnfC subunit